MYLSRLLRLYSCVSVCAGLSAVSGSASAASFSFTGTFTTDDQLEIFSFVAGPSSAILRTWGFAGGMNAAGSSISAGGFDPILSLFGPGNTLQASTNLLATVNDGIGVPADVDGRMAAVAADAMNALTDTTSTYLSGFSGHGGKLLFYHGMSDTGFSPLDTIDYYQKMGKANGGMDEVLNWSRLFLVPGMGHCRGGAATLDDFDLLSAAVNWVEKGTAPESVVATGKAFPGRSRPLCAFPKYAHYKGQGDPQDAKNFACRE